MRGRIFDSYGVAFIEILLLGIFNPYRIEYVKKKLVLGYDAIGVEYINGYVECPKGMIDFGRGFGNWEGRFLDFLLRGRIFDSYGVVFI